MKRLDEITVEIIILKKQLAELWETKGKTDQEVLDLAEKIDKLLNEYDHQLQGKVS